MSTALEGHVYGAYRVWFDPFIPGTFTKTGRLRFGYVPNISLSGSVENLEGFDPDDGIPVKVAEVQTSSSQSLSFTMESIDPPAIAAAILGSTDVFTQTNTPVTDEAISFKKGRVYQLGGHLGFGAGVRNVTSVTVTEDVQETPETYVLNTDYTLDAAGGRITWLAEDVNGLVDYTPASETREVILAGGTPHRGELFLEARNPVGTRRDVLFPFVSLTLNGDWALKSDNAFQQIPFSVALNKLTSATPLFLFQKPTANA